MQVVVYKSEEGVSVITPADNISLDEAIRLTVPEDTRYAVLDDKALPDCYFRDAWTIEDNFIITIDIEKAKNIQKDYWRHARSQKLQKLDYQFMLALEENDEKKINIIKQKKQALRDVTLIQLPNTIEDIKNTWPVILNDDCAD